MLKKGFLIDLEEKPQSDEDFCQAIAAHFARSGEAFEFESRTQPIVFCTDDKRYGIELKWQKTIFLNAWALHCKELE